MKKIINQAPIVRYRASVSEIFFPDSWNGTFSAESLIKFDSPRGKSHLQRAYELYSKWYSEWVGDNNDLVYQEVLQLKGVRGEKRLVLLTTGDNCGYGTEFSIALGRISSEEETWLKNLLSLAFSCCHIGEEVADQIPLDRLIGMAQDYRFKSWASTEMRAVVDSLLQNYDHVTRTVSLGVTVKDLQSSLFRTYKQNQEKLRELILTRYKLQKRSKMGGNC